MKPTRKVVYQTAEQFEAVIKAREADAAKLPQGKVKEAVLVEVALLRSYARLQQALAHSAHERVR
jgi:hypothetical protein